MRELIRVSVDGSLEEARSNPQGLVQESLFFTSWAAPADMSRFFPLGVAFL